MNDRLRMLREDMKLSRAAFGDKLGVSGDVINNLERGRVEIKEHIVKLICAEYSVNEEWLRNGTEPMYVQPDAFSLDDFVKSKGATGLELEIVKTYFELDPQIRKAAMDHFKRRLAAAVAADPALLVPDSEEELEAQCPPVDTGNASGVDAG
ncbi:MAG: helix-turn-helix transcriptional regulator [Phascolarctobacterium sp.]|nr:helix-turn-helix transcriptional regulator [Candidatus Phascolarctobacterium caballi]